MGDVRMGPADRQPIMSFQDLLKSESSDSVVAPAQAQKPLERVTLPGMPDQFFLGLWTNGNRLGWLGLVTNTAFFGYAGLVTDRSDAIPLGWGWNYYQHMLMPVNQGDGWLSATCLYASREDYVGFGMRQYYHEGW